MSRNGWDDTPPRFPPGFEDRTPLEHLNQPKPRSKAQVPPPPPPPEPSQHYQPLPSPDPEARVELAAIKERERARDAREAVLERELEEHRRSKKKTGVVAGGALVAALAAGVPQIVDTVESFGEKAKVEKAVAEKKLQTEDERLGLIKDLLKLVRKNQALILDMQNNMCVPPRVEDK